MSARIAIVTGGTKGLGRSIALALASEGHIPVLVYKSDAAAADATLKEVQELSPSAIAEPADVADPSSLGRVIDKVTTELGPIGILVHGALRSGRAPKKVHETDPAGWKEDLATNLDGAFYAARAVLPSMLTAQFGRIVFLGSLAARGEMGKSSYSTSKAALAGLSGTIAQEYAREGITSNIVSPGFIDAGAFTRLPPDIKDRAQKRVPSQRLGTAEEVAALVAYLTSDEAGYTTGQVISLDGGTR